MKWLTSIQALKIPRRKPRERDITFNIKIGWRRMSLEEKKNSATVSGRRIPVQIVPIIKKTMDGWMAAM